jgi:hypothetical protein
LERRQFIDIRNRRLAEYGGHPYHSLSCSFATATHAQLDATIGPSRQRVETNDASKRRHLVIVSGSADKPEAPDQPEAEL